MTKYAEFRLQLICLILGLATVAALLVNPTGISAAAASTGPVGGAVSIMPTRILDTRTTSGPVPGGGTVSVRISGAHGFPYGTQAVVVNITATEPTASGFLTAYHSGVSKPPTSNVNFGRGQTVANLAIVEVGNDDHITIANTSAGSVHIVLDASAYFGIAGSWDAPGSYRPLALKRALDTRTSTGPVAGGGNVLLRVGDVPEVPSNADAVVVNLTVTEPTSNGFISVYPTGSSKPNISNQNYGQGQTIPTLAVVPVGPDGTVTIANSSSGTVQIVVDVFGFFLPGTPSTAGAFAAIAPKRFLDTRTFRGPAVNAEAVPVQVAGVNGVPANAKGVWVNLTVTESTTFGYFEARGHWAPFSFTSNLNFDRRQTIANMAYVTIGRDGKIEIQALLNQVPRLETTHVIADIFGYTL